MDCWIHRSYKSREKRLQIVFSCSAGEEAGELNLEGEESMVGSSVTSPVFLFCLAGMFSGNA